MLQGAQGLGSCTPKKTRKKIRKNLISVVFSWADEQPKKFLKQPRTRARPPPISEITHGLGALGRSTFWAWGPRAGPGHPSRRWVQGNTLPSSYDFRAQWLHSCAEGVWALRLPLGSPGVP